MNKADFLRLFRYSDNCWDRLGDLFAATPGMADAWNTPFDTVSKWNTVRLLLAHSIGAEQRLVTTRLLHQPRSVPYEDHAASDWPDLLRDHQTTRADSYDYLESLTDLELEDDEEVWKLNGISLTRVDILFQILNHENYHRGQVVMALQRLGLDPPDFDYVLLR